MRFEFKEQYIPHIAYNQPLGAILTRPKKRLHNM